MPLVCGVCFSAKQTVTIVPGGSSTAVHEEYSMWVMPMSTFVELDQLQPHQLLKQTGKLVARRIITRALKEVFPLLRHGR